MRKAKWRAAFRRFRTRRGIPMKKLTAAALAVLLVCSLGAVGVSAQGSGGVVPAASADLINEDGAVKASTGDAPSGGSLSFDVAPNQTLYLRLGPADSGAGRSVALIEDESGESYVENNVTPKELANSDLFRLKSDKDGAGKGLVKVSQYNEKSIGGSGRSAWLKIDIGESQTDEELKARLDLTFTARRDQETDDGDFLWKKGDYALLRLTFYINNDLQKGDDVDADPGDEFVYDPVSNEKNMVTWDRVATLAFTADDDASKFYAKLSTKANPVIYETYGDPVGAELFFRDFTGSPAISATSRAVLTLLYPWPEEDDGAPVPEKCRIYSKNVDGELTDVSSLFSYVEEDEDGNEVNGWRTKIRTLGCYIISDKELDTSRRPQTEPETPAQTWQAPPAVDVNKNTKVNPPTGK